MNRGSIRHHRRKTRTHYKRSQIAEPTLDNRLLLSVRERLSDLAGLLNELLEVGRVDGDLGSRGGRPWRTIRLHQAEDTGKGALFVRDSSPAI